MDIYVTTIEGDILQSERALYEYIEEKCGTDIKALFEGKQQAVEESRHDRMRELEMIADSQRMSLVDARDAMIEMSEAKCTKDALKNRAKAAALAIEDIL